MIRRWELKEGGYIAGRGGRRVRIGKRARRKGEKEGKGGEDTPISVHLSISSPCFSYNDR
jgi:hypothetical protein